MSRGREDHELLRYAEGELAEEARRRVEARLAGSERERRRLRELRAGIESMRELEPEALPEGRAREIEAALLAAATASAGPTQRRRRLRLGAAAALALALAGGLVLRARLAPHVELRPSAEPATPLERAALRLQTEQAEGRLSLDLATRSPAEAKRFIRAHAALSAQLVEARPAEDGGRYALDGVKLLDVAGASAAALAYRIDDRPVLLLTAAAADVADRPPHWSPLRAGKEVRFRFRDGRKLLSWTNVGQTYVLVSDLPRFGEQSCYLCHGEPGRRTVIDSLGS